MTILWSPDGPQLKKPGGIFWRVMSFMHTAAQMQKLTTAISTMYTNNGVLAASMQKMSSAINGRMLPSGSIADTMQPLTTAVTGSQVIPGSVTDTMMKPLTAVQIAQIDSGTIADAIPAPPSTAVQAAQGIGMAIGSSIAGPPSSALAVSASPAGTIAALVGQLSTGIAASEMPQGQIAVALALASSAITGSQAQVGSVTALLQQAQTALAGAQTQSGSIAGALKQAITALSLNYLAANAPQFDAVSATVVNTSGTTGAVTITLGSNATAYFVFNDASSRTISSVKNGAGTAMTLVASQAQNNSASSGTTYVYKMTGLAAGSQTFTVTFSSSTGKFSGFAFSITNVDHEIVYSTQFASTTSMNEAVDANLRASKMAVGVFGAATGLLGAGSGGTAIATAQQASSGGGISARYTATAGVTLGFTSGTSGALAGIVLEFDALPSPTTSSTTAGTTTQTVPASGTVDLVALGAGGSGSFGSINNGNPGAAGGWATATGLVVGTDILAGSTITITIGAGGVGVTGSNASGNAGGNTTISYYDMSSVLHTITGTGGAGGTGSDGSGSTSPGLRPSPVSQLIRDVNYVSGTTATGGAHPAGDGLPPGASGAGMTSTSGTSPYGANGGAWVTVQ